MLMVDIIQFSQRICTSADIATSKALLDLKSLILTLTAT